MSEAPLNLHAGCILLGEAGILIRGPSGSGKSTLARRLVAERRAKGGFAALVADDRVLVARRGGRLVGRPHPAIAGLIEQRGFGLLRVPYEEAAVLRLVVDLAEAPRLPQDDEMSCLLLGVKVPRIAGPATQVEALIETAISWPR